VRLGARAFNLFDPTTLLSELVERIRRSFVQSAAGKFRWNDPSFQNYSSQNAKSAIEIIAALADITAKEAQLNGEAFLTFCQSLIVLLVKYQSFKKKIPLDSRWYPIRYSHPDWYRSDDSATSLSITSKLEMSGLPSSSEIVRLRNEMAEGRISYAKASDACSIN
jgi:hypothetical protein